MKTLQKSVRLGFVIFALVCVVGVLAPKVHAQSEGDFSGNCDFCGGSFYDTSTPVDSGSYYDTSSPVDSGSYYDTSTILGYYNDTSSPSDYGSYYDTSSPVDSGSYYDTSTAFNNVYDTYGSDILNGSYTTDESGVRYSSYDYGSDSYSYGGMSYASNSYAPSYQATTFAPPHSTYSFPPVTFSTTQTNRPTQTNYPSPAPRPVPQPVVQQQQQQQQQQAPAPQPITIVNTNTNTNVNTPAPVAPVVPVYQTPPQVPVQYVFQQPIQIPVYQNLSCSMSASSGYLTWNSSGSVTSATMSNGIGYVAPNGSMPIRPGYSNDYTLTVYGQNGQSAHCNAFVAVAQPIAPYVSLTQIPYTGFDFGTTGNAIYWLSLLSFAVAAAYLLVYYQGGTFALASGIFGFATTNNEKAGGAVKYNSSEDEDTDPLFEAPVAVSIAREEPVAYVAPARTPAPIAAYELPITQHSNSVTHDAMTLVHAKAGEAPRIVIARG